MTRVEQFSADTEHAQLGQSKVAREVVYLLTHHDPITPLHLARACLALGWPDSMEWIQMLAGWLLDDGWVYHSDRPFVGAGMDAVWSYVPTPRWHALVEM